MSKNQFRKYVQSVFPFIEAAVPSKEEFKISKTKKKEILVSDLLVPVAKACRPLRRRKQAFIDKRQLSLCDEMGGSSNAENDCS